MKKKRWLPTLLTLIAAFLSGAISAFLLEKRKELIAARRSHLGRERLQVNLSHTPNENNNAAVTTPSKQSTKRKNQELSPEPQWLLLPIFIALLLAAAGPVFVFLDRWLDNGNFRMVLRNLWCQSDILCRSIFPSYFIYILPASILAVVLLVFFTPRSLPQFLAKHLQPNPAPPANKEFSVKRKETIKFLGWAALVFFLAEILLTLTGLRKPGPEYPLLILILLVIRFLQDFSSKFKMQPLKQIIPAWLLPFALVLVALVFLMGFLSRLNFFILIPMTVLILGSLWLFPHRKQIPAILWITLAMIPLYSFFLNSWRYSVIGDEYVFFNYGKMVLENQPLRMIFENLISPNTVIYGKFPFLSVLPNILSMAFFGINNFGWRIVNPLMCAFSLPFLYHFFEYFTSKKTALAFSILMAGSHLLITFSKVGYNNLQGLLVMGVILWLSRIVLERKRPGYYLLLGVSLGLALLMYPTTFAIIPLPFVLLYLFNNPICIGKEIAPEQRKPIRNARLTQWLWLLIGFSILFFPVALEPNYWEIKMTESVFSGHMAADYTFHFITNLLYTFFSPIYAPEESHFVVSSFLDPISGIFLFVGFAWGLKYLFKNKFAFFMVSSFVIQVLILGPTREHGWTSATHMFQLIPWLCLFVVLGIQWLLDFFHQKISSSTRKKGLGILIGIIILTNFYMAFVLSPQRSDRYYLVEALSLRFFEQTETLGIGEDAQYLYLTSPGWDIHGIRDIQNVYGYPPNTAQLTRSPLFAPDDPAKFELEGSQWVSLFEEIPTLNDPKVMAVPDANMEQWAFEQIDKPGVIVAIDPLLPSDQTALMIRLMKQVGRKPCVLRASPNSDARITFWLSPEWEPICPSDGIWGNYW